MNQVHLENELAHERAQVDKLNALLEAERAHVESLRMALRMALRMIEPGQATHQKQQPLQQYHHQRRDQNKTMYGVGLLGRQKHRVCSGDYSKAVN